MLVLDDVHELVNVDAMNFIAALAAGVPPGFHIAIGARLGLGLARLRSEGRCLEFGLNDLAFTGDEARQVLAVAGVACSGQEVATIIAAHPRLAGRGVPVRARAAGCTR